MSWDYLMDWIRKVIPVRGTQSGHTCKRKLLVASLAQW